MACGGWSLEMLLSPGSALHSPNPGSDPAPGAGVMQVRRGQVEAPVPRATSVKPSDRYNTPGQPMVFSLVYRGGN